MQVARSPLLFSTVLHHRQFCTLAAFRWPRLCSVEVSSPTRYTGLFSYSQHPNTCYGLCNGLSGPLCNLVAPRVTFDQLHFADNTLDRHARLMSPLTSLTAVLPHVSCPSASQAGHYAAAHSTTNSLTSHHLLQSTRCSPNSCSIVSHTTFESGFSRRRRFLRLQDLVTLRVSTHASTSIGTNTFYCFKEI